MMRCLLAGLLMLFCLGAQAHGHHAHHDAGQAAIAFISVGQLPPEGRDTLQAIKRGGPFAYERDGVVFGNFERILPVRPRGYYHEYTVKTPGARNRGARRLISGATNEYYYTADHYQTFQRIQE
ncbi:MAG: ribonuclease domain-containing protein [Gallionella sp.]|jgi:ribonuclease T1